jgi:hypothetical protein
VIGIVTFAVVVVKNTPTTPSTTTDTSVFVTPSTEP